MKTTKQFAVSQTFTRKQAGFTLIEALVAFLILSIGMLGIGSLQLVSLKAGHTAAFRTVAVIKVEEMFERIRNNPSEVLSYGGVAGLNKDCNDYSGINACTKEDMVFHDVYEWEQGLTGSLGTLAGVTTTIVVAPPVVGTQPLAVVTVSVNWQERNPETQTMIAMNYSAVADICVTTAC